MRKNFPFQFVPHPFNWLLLSMAFVLICFSSSVQATGEASTYFEIFVPPNNDRARRDVSLIVTAIYDSTYFSIVDDGADGDTDDSANGWLMAGQSYVLYLRENGVNDDAPHPGEGNTKQDGDYFIVTGTKLLLASQSTNSDWQHDWVPATNRSSKGQQFIVYSPPTSFSNRDLNVFAYEDSTAVTIRKISWAAQTTSGYTNVDFTSGTIVVQKTLNVGEDLIFSNTEGRNLMETGATYVVESNRSITLQYGALYQNARDGGGYVPSNNGSSAGELFYFAVPFQANKEQEIRIVSWDDGNQIFLEQFTGGSWVNVSSWSLDRLEAGEWVSYTGNLSKVLRVRCSSGKKVSVFEANWLESGSPGTSDIASMVSSNSGTSAGQEFLVYMAPPGYENRVTNPITGLKFNQATHLYMFARDTAHVTVKDAGSNGQTISRTYTILPGRYVDCYLNLSEWYSIYNGNGNPNSGSERPYLLVESDAAISVFNTNFNDNWMAYLGTSQTQDFEVGCQVGQPTTVPGDTMVVNSDVSFTLTDSIYNPEVVIQVGDGADVLYSYFINLSTNDTVVGQAVTQTSGKTKITFSGLPNMDPNHQLVTQAGILPSANFSDGSPVPQGTIIAIESSLSGTNGGVLQQASCSSGITNQTNDQSKLIFAEEVSNHGLTNSLGNHWGVAFSDFNNDGYDDVFLPDYDRNVVSQLLVNDGTGNYFQFTHTPVTNQANGAVASSWADFNNDGNLDLAVGLSPDNTNKIYLNQGNCSFSNVSMGDATSEQGYTHGLAWADVNNDGFVDLFSADYMPTQFNRLYLNDGGTGFTASTDATILSTTGYSIGATWCDFDNDGDQDLYVPNNKSQRNYLYENTGNGRFVEVVSTDFSNDAFSSTGCTWGDYDNDGDFDLYVTNASNQVNNLYRNDGGSFTKITNSIVATETGHSHGAAWGDFNNDGHLDLLVTNDQNTTNRLYLNKGDGTFEAKENESIAGRDGNPMAVACADIDRDGDLDAYIVHRDHEGNHLFLNNGNANHWLQLRLEGTNSNRSAIGARVSVKANINGNAVWQHRFVSAQSGGGASAQSSFVLHFGLANATQVDSILIHWPSGYTEYISNQAVDAYVEIVEEDASLVSGTLYYDANQNCVQDLGEKGIPDLAVLVQPEGKMVYTNASGVYSIRVARGNHTISPAFNNTWNNACVAAYNLNVLCLGQSFTDNDFGLFASCTTPDLKVALANTALRRGFQNDWKILISNEGAGAASGTELSLTFDCAILPKASHPAWDQQQVVNGKTVLTWQLDTVWPLTEMTIAFVDSIDQSAPLGKIAGIDAELSAVETDCDPANNATRLEDEVVGSLDPNDLAVFPKGWGSKGVIDATQELIYRIRFQNVGNYYASIVTIVDTLPKWVDLSTVKVIQSSHPGQFSVSETGILTWQATKIMLPDSATDNSGSNGDVWVQVQLLETVPPGTPLFNQVSIRFDYNEPILTNQVLNTVAGNLSNPSNIKVVIAPNPAQTKTTVSLQVFEALEVLPQPIESIELFNESSQAVPVTYHLQEYTAEVELGQLSSGSYFIAVTDTSGHRYFGKLIIVQ